MTGNALHFINAYGRSLHSSGHFVVGHDEGYAAYRLDFGRKNYFEEAARYCNSGLTDAFDGVVGKHRAADNDE